MLEVKTVIEHATIADAVEIGAMSKHDIEQGLGWKYTPDRIASLMAEDSKNVVVARLGSRLIGFGIMTYHEDQANLDLLAVKRGFRRMKTGTQIVQWLEDVAKASGSFNIFVQLRTNNSSATMFYKSLGFIVIDQLERYYNNVEPALIMAKSIRTVFNIR